MSPQEKHFGVDLSDEVVRGAIVTNNGEILPRIPRPSPPPSPPPPTQAAGEGSKKASAVALTPWQKTSREVATVTGGMGAALALGKATGPLFMSNMFTCGLAGLIGYRAVWGVAPALHSPLMSVTNAISGDDAFTMNIAPSLIYFLSRHGRRRRFLYHGRRVSAWDFPSGPWRIVGTAGVRERIRRIRHHQAYAGHV